jgi:hypothetical protein
MGKQDAYSRDVVQQRPMNMAHISRNAAVHIVEFQRKSQKLFQGWFLHV